MVKRELFRGIAAGVMIGIGGAVFLASENKVVGAILFAVALLSICLLGLSLFTGKVGFLAYNHKKTDFGAVLVCLLGNLIGTFLSAFLAVLSKPAYAVVARDMCEGKLTKGFGEIIGGAVLCGVLMFTAVYTYRNNKTLAGIFFCVPVFILSGFEHSIADMFYFWASGLYTLKTLLFIGLVIVGNAIGGVLIPSLLLLSEGKKND